MDFNHVPADVRWAIGLRDARGYVEHGSVIHMRVINDWAVGRAIEQFGSGGFSVLTVGRQVNTTLARLEPGGRIGRHPAVVDQCLIAVSGEAVVSSDDASATLRAGEAVLWEAGEQHETFSEVGMVALVLEGEGIRRALDAT